MRRLLVVTLAAAVLVTTSCVPLPAPYPYRNTLPAGLRPPVTLIGDSTMAAMVWYASAGRTAQSHLQAAYTTTIVAQSCQRLIGTSCRGRFGSRPPTTLDEMRIRAGRLGEAVVVMAGYDDVDIGPGVDAIMAEANRQGVPFVLFLTYRANVSYVLPGGARARDLYARHNAILQDRARRYPTMRLADWNGHTAAHPEWFASDGIHLSPAGTVELARFIRIYLASLPLGRCMPQLTVGAPRSGAAAWVGASGAGISATQPRTVFDSRPGGTDPNVRKLGADRMVRVSVPAFVPATSPKMSVRVTAADPCRAGRIHVVNCGQNPLSGPGVAFIGGRSAGFGIAIPRADVCVWVGAPTDVVVQVIGWVAPPPPPPTTTPPPPPTTTAATATTVLTTVPETTAVPAPETTTTTAMPADTTTTAP